MRSVINFIACQFFRQTVEMLCCYIWNIPSKGTWQSFLYFSFCPVLEKQIFYDLPLLYTYVAKPKSLSFCLFPRGLSYSQTGLVSLGLIGSVFPRDMKIVNGCLNSRWLTGKRITSFSCGAYTHFVGTTTSTNVCPKYSDDVAVRDN